MKRHINEFIGWLKNTDHRHTQAPTHLLDAVPVMYVNVDVKYSCVESMGGGGKCLNGDTDTTRWHRTYLSNSSMAKTISLI